MNIIPKNDPIKSVNLRTKSSHIIVTNANNSDSDVRLYRYAITIVPITTSIVLNKFSGSIMVDHRKALVIMPTAAVITTPTTMIINL